MALIHLPCPVHPGQKPGFPEFAAYKKSAPAAFAAETPAYVRGSTLLRIDGLTGATAWIERLEICRRSACMAWIRRQYAGIFPRSVAPSGMPNADSRVLSLTLALNADDTSASTRPNDGALDAAAHGCISAARIGITLSLGRALSAAFGYPLWPIRTRCVLLPISAFALYLT